MSISRNDAYASVIQKGLLRVIYEYWDASRAALTFAERVNRDFSAEAIDEALSALFIAECDQIYLLFKIEINHCIKRNDGANRHMLKLLELFQTCIGINGYINKGVDTDCGGLITMVKRKLDPMDEEAMKTLIYGTDVMTAD